MSNRKRTAFKLLALALSALFSLGVLEVGCLVMEARAASKSYHRGVGGLAQPDARWGWKPAPGTFEESTPEFTVVGNVNRLFMNDGPFHPESDQKKTRIMAVGDSHTYATGASLHETWSKVLDKELNAGRSDSPYRVYNAGCYGYNLHQYLLRIIDQGPVLKPDYVVVGFSFATDLYDLLPPDRGGWTYGVTTQPRDYFEFDETGSLTLRHWKPDPLERRAAANMPGLQASSVRELLQRFAIVRALRRSSIAIYIGSHLTVGGQSLWPNMDVVLERKTSPKHEYNWKLAEALLLKIKEESARLGAKAVVVGIPYLPQVYDEIWNASFGDNPSYDRRAAITRLAKFCRANGIPYVDTLDALRAQTRTLKRWVHHPMDAHPTREGQATIAKAVAKSGLFTEVQH